MKQATPELMLCSSLSNEDVKRRPAREGSSPFRVDRLFNQTSKLPGHAQLGAYAQLLAYPAGEAKVDGYGAVSIGLDLPAQLQHTAAAFDAGGGGAEAVVGGAGVAVEFVLVGKAAVEAVLVVYLNRILYLFPISFIV